MTRDEWKIALRTWSCRGGGLAVLMLLATVVWFRQPRDVIFWAAIAFFVAHTVIATWRYVRDRRLRTTAEVIRHHRSHPVSPAPIAPQVFFSPAPITSLIRLDVYPPK